MQPTSGTAPVNRVSQDALDELRSTRLSLTERLLCRLPAGTRNAAAARVHALVQGLHVGATGGRLRERPDQHAAPSDAPGELTVNDLTLAHTTSWAVPPPSSQPAPPAAGETAPQQRVTVERFSDASVGSEHWDALRDELHADVFFISINGQHEAADWAGTQRASGYLTDLYKGISVPTQDAIVERLGAEHCGLVLDVMLELLHEELAILRGPVKPVLACLSREVEAPIREHFAPLGYEVVYVPSSSAATGAVPLDERRAAFARIDEALARAVSEPLIVSDAR